MRVKLYAGILAVFLTAASAIAAYGASNNITGDIIAEDSNDICTSNAQDIVNSCTAQQNCGQPGCGALENKPCGCKSACQIR